MAAPIKAGDTSVERITKLLPADVTAAFLSAKAGLTSFFGTPNDAGPVFWTFVAILALCPFYFWFVSKVESVPQIVFLCLSFVVFALSIADLQFMNFFPGIRGLIQIASIVLPILWAFLIAQIFIGAMGDRINS